MKDSENFADVVNGSPFLRGFPVRKTTGRPAMNSLKLIIISGVHHVANTMAVFPLSCLDASRLNEQKENPTRILGKAQFGQWCKVRRKLRSAAQIMAVLDMLTHYNLKVVVDVSANT